MKNNNLWLLLVHVPEAPERGNKGWSVVYLLKSDGVMQGKQIRLVA
jgi:hypothetical protein